MFQQSTYSLSLFSDYLPICWLLPLTCPLCCWRGLSIWTDDHVHNHPLCQYNWSLDNWLTVLGFIVKSYLQLSSWFPWGLSGCRQGRSAVNLLTHHICRTSSRPRSVTAVPNGHIIPSGSFDFTWSYWGLCLTVDLSFEAVMGQQSGTRPLRSRMLQGSVLSPKINLLMCQNSQSWLSS